MLPGDVEKRLGDQGGHLEGGKLAVDVDLALVLSGEHPLDHDGILRLDPLFRKPLADPRVGSDVKEGLDQALLFVRSDDVVLDPIPQNQAEGVEEDGFAAAGLSSEHIEAFMEIDAQLIDDREILNVELPQHGNPITWIRYLLLTS